MPAEGSKGVTFEDKCGHTFLGAGFVFFATCNKHTVALPHLLKYPIFSGDFTLATKNANDLRSGSAVAMDSSSRFNPKNCGLKDPTRGHWGSYG